MNFEDAKKQILVMAKDITDGNFTEQTLSEFVLSFRHDLFQQQQQVPKGIWSLTCSCGPELKSCDEWGWKLYQVCFWRPGKHLRFCKG